MDIYDSRDKKSNCSNNIVDVIERIVKMQRNVCSTCAEPVSCDMCFYNSAFNTIPIRLTTCCSVTPIEAVIGAGGPSTSYFRVESICNNRYVKLRLLTIEGEGTLAGTNYTIVVDLECIGSIQCFEPINIVATPPAV